MFRGGWSGGVDGRRAFQKNDKTAFSIQVYLKVSKKGEGQCHCLYIEGYETCRGDPSTKLVQYLNAKNLSISQ